MRRARLLSLIVMFALLIGPLAPPLRASWVISGTVDCGRASGDRCSLGPTLALITDDLGKPGQHVTIDAPDWLVEQLGGVDQDDLLAIEVENGPDGKLTPLAVVSTTGGTINAGLSTGSKEIREAGRAEPDEPDVKVGPPQAGSAPTAVADAYAAGTATLLSVSPGIGLLANDLLGTPPAVLVSFGGGSLGGAVTSNAAGTTVAVGSGALRVNADGSFTFSSNAGFTGPFTFQYRIQNAAGTSDATVTLTVATSSVTPTAVSDAYNAVTATVLTVGAGSGPPAGLLVNDALGAPAATLVSFGGGSLGGSVTTNAAGSTVAIGSGSLRVNADGSFAFTSNAGFTGSFTFQYRLQNAAATSDATVNIAVTASAVAPTARADGYVAASATLLSVNAGSGLLFNDTLGAPAATLVSFGGGSLGGTVTTNAAGATAPVGSGSLRVNADGSFAFTSNVSFSGPFTFQYRIQNSAGPSDATVTITVTAPTRPTAVNDQYTAVRNVTLNVPAGFGMPAGLLVNDVPGTPPATVVSFGGGSTGGVVTTYLPGTFSAVGGELRVNTDGSFTFTARTVTPTAFTFQYRIQNAAGFSDATVTISVSDPQAAPGTQNDGYSAATGVTLNAGPGLQAVTVIANDRLGNPAATLVSFGGDSLGGSVTTYPAGTTVPFGSGSLRVGSDGSFTFTSDVGFTGFFRFQYRIQNALGFADGVVNILVSPTLSQPAFAGTLGSGSTTSSGDFTITTTSAVPAGNLIVVTVALDQPDDRFSLCSDPINGTYVLSETQAALGLNLVTNVCFQFAAQALPAGSQITIRAASGATRGVAVASQFSGAITHVQFNKGAAGTSATPSAGAVSIGQAPALIFAGYAVRIPAGGVTVSPGSTGSSMPCATSGTPTLSSAGTATQGSPGTGIQAFGEFCIVNTIGDYAAPIVVSTTVDFAGAMLAVGP